MGSSGMGQCMLQTTPESLHEKLPYAEEISGLVITADARIDNREELGEALGVMPLVRKGIPDSHLILLSYRKWGQDCPKHLLGDFSFAIWDSVQQRLFCAVDTFSVRPFCYHNSQQRFIFASEISGLLPGDLTPKVVNEVRIASQFIYMLGELDKHSTLYKDIFYLPAAHCLVVDSRGLTIWNYWNPEEISETTLADDAAYEENFTALLKESIRCRLRSNDDTALALSGGIDSASIAAHSLDLLAETGARQVTYSGISAKENACLESDYIRQGLPTLSQHPVTFTPEVLTSMRQKLLDVMATYHYPGGISSLFLLCLYNRTSQDGHRVMLDGAEGDTVLGLGPLYIAHLMRKGKLYGAIKETYLYCKHTYNGEVSPFPLLTRSMKSASMPRSLHHLLYFLRLQISSYGYGNNVPLRQSFTDSIDLNSLMMQARQRIGFGLADSPGEQHRQLFQSPFMGRMYYGLDMLSAPFSLELRHPYLDRRLVEFSLGLPWQQKNRDGWEKWILRKSRNPAIPTTIRWRRKRDHVGWRFLNTFMGSIEEELADIVHDKSSMIFQYLDYDAVQSIYKYYKSGQQKKSQTEIHMIYSVETWLKNHAA